MSVLKVKKLGAKIGSTVLLILLAVIALSVVGLVGGGMAIWSRDSFVAIGLPPQVPGILLLCSLLGLGIAFTRGIYLHLNDE